MYLITGGTGFLGSYVVRDLLRDGEAVTLYDLRPDEQTLGLVAGREAIARCTIVQGDVTSAPQLFAAVRDANPSVIVHLASPLPPDSERDTTVSLAQMTQGHVNVLEAARVLGVEKVVWASATSVFGPPERHGGVDVTVANDAPHYPVTLYGICKSANERLATLYWERHGVDSVGFRFCQGYGPGKRRGRPFGYQMFESALLGRPCVLPYGDDVINWQPVDEMAEIVLRASRAAPGPTRVFNTTGEVVPMRDSVALLARLAPQAKVSVEPGTAGLVWRYDASRLEAELGFRTRTRIEEGFRRTLETLRAWKEAGTW